MEREMVRMRTKLALILIAFALILAACGQPSDAPQSDAVVLLKVGHVGHDHHLALFVACDTARDSGIHLKVVEDRKHYELFDGARKLADIELVRVGGGSKMPTALAQDVIEVGLGGTAPVLAAVDKGAPLRLIAPLHSKGDMLAVRPDFPAKNWNEFVAAVKASPKPVRVGYKNPIAVAKIIFEEALMHEGLAFAPNSAAADAKVVLINVKGGKKLNASLQGGLIDAYVGNNPFPAMGEEKEILRIIADLEDLPPGTFRNHPCCCVAAGMTAIKEKSEAITALLVLLHQATDTINTDRDKAVAVASRWIGTSESVERASIPTSGYSMTDDATWHASMAQWLKAMNRLDLFTKTLKGLAEPEAAKLAYDLTALEKAEERLAIHAGE
jgi:sulfonate transport system substrate-binding protein